MSGLISLRNVVVGIVAVVKDLLHAAAAADICVTGVSEISVARSASYHQASQSSQPAKPASQARFDSKEVELSRRP